MKQTAPIRRRQDHQKLSRLFGALLLAGLAPLSWAAEVPLQLTYNFNGMVHPGEAEQPDLADGFRSISDRALIIDGAPMSFGDVTSPASGLSYDIVDAGGTLDILHIGDRNTVDNGNWAFDPVPDGDDVGIQPDWLPDPDQTTVSEAIAPGIELDSTAAVGLLYQISNGGGDFDLTLGFSDGSSVTVTLNGPDWFGPFAGIPDPPAPGVDLQQNLGIGFTGSQNVDSADPGPPLIVTEATITAADLSADLGFDLGGRTLTGLTFGNRSNAVGGYAVLAVTVVGRDPLPIEIPAASHTGLTALGALLALAGAVLLWRRHLR